jgi:hypothetical protein
LSTVAGEAQRRGDHLLTEVGAGPLGPRLGRRVTIRLGWPVRFPSMTSLPLTWEPVGLEGVLPRLDANIELGSLGEDRTQSVRPRQVVAERLGVMRAGGCVADQGGEALGIVPPELWSELVDEPLA